jgi:hypothetical protein
MNVLSLLPFFVLVSIALVVVFAELIKKLDKKDRFKGYRVYITPGAVIRRRLAAADRGFFVPGQMWFWWMVIFGFSVFAYEAVLKKLESAFAKNG